MIHNTYIKYFINKIVKRHTQKLPSSIQQYLTTHLRIKTLDISEDKVNWIKYRVASVSPGDTRSLSYNNPDRKRIVHNQMRNSIGIPFNEDAPGQIMDVIVWDSMVHLWAWLDCALWRFRFHVSANITCTYYLLRYVLHIYS